MIERQDHVVEAFERLASGMGLVVSSTRWEAI